MYSRRKLLTLTLLFAAALTPALAQIPRTISFQGVLADASGVLLPDGTTQLTIAIYDVPAGGTALFSETLTVPVVRGVFNAVIGSSNPNGIPTSVAFDKQYWLGVRVATGAELSPRTPFTSVPYALNAAMAERAQTAVTADSADWAMTSITSDTAGAVRGGHVISFNGQQGAIEILGAGATTVTRNGSQFIIRSTDTSSGGIRRIDNFDGSLVIDPPQGPFVTMFIREGGVQTHHLRDLSITTAKIIDQQVTTPKIADNAVTSIKIANGTIITEDLANNSVTAAKVNTEGAPDGYALISNGTNTPGWENPLTANIPYAETFNSPLTLWWLTNIGTGGGGRYTLNNTGSSATALIGETNGTGVGVLGTHSATTGTAAGVRGESNSTDGNAVAVQGVITSTSPGGFSSGVRGVNNGTGGLGIGVYGSQAGSGWGVYGTTPNGIGVHGSSTNGFGVYALSSNGIGSYGLSTNGESGRFENTNSANTSNALTGQTNGAGAGISAINTGTGKGANVLINNATNSMPALDAATTGTGNAGMFTTSNVANTAATVAAYQNGTGRAILGRRGAGSGISLGQTEAIRGDNTDGPGVAGTSNSAVGVYGTSLTSHGIWGVAVTSGNAGVLGRNDVAGGYGVWGQSFGGGIGIYGSSQTGSAASFQITNAASTAPVVDVSHAGIGSGIRVQLTNAANGARGIDVMQAGVGPGVFATSAGGNAVWGITSSISAAGVIGDNTFGEAVVGRNRGGNGVGAVVGRNDSSGYGVRGFNTKDGIGVLGQAGISGGTGVGGRFENVNAANGNDALQAATNGTGWAGNFTNANNSSATRGVRISTTAGQGGNALTLANGTFATSYQHPYASNTVVDDATLVVTVGGAVTIPTGPPLVDGAHLWVVNNAGVLVTVTNTTIGGLNIAPGMAAELVFVSTVSGANWIPVQ